MKILVTGGAGFLGSTLVDRLLVEEHEVDVVDDLRSGAIANLASARAEASGRLKIDQLDVRDSGIAQLIQRRRPEVVFHLATATDRSGATTDAEAASIDVSGTVQVLGAAAAAGVAKVVLAGSARADVGASSRCVTRRFVDQLADHFRAERGLEYTTVVMPTVYGPRQRSGRESSVVASFLERLVDGRPCVVHGSGEQTRDLLYVDDAVDALVKACHAADGLRVEIGSGRQTTITSLHRALAAMLERDGEAVPGAPRADEPGAVPVDITRAEMYLDWRPFTPLAEGLTDAVVELER